MKILVIEDSVRLADTIAEALLNENYVVDTANDGQLGYEHASTGIYDMVILDLMLPKMNGYEVLSALRRDGDNVPVLILSAKTEIDDKIQGFTTGADDYMTKPFGVLELQARVRSLLRRHAPKAAPIIESQTLKIDKQTRIVMHNGQVMELTNKQYQLLLYLVENHKRVVERDEILNHIWGYDFIGESRVLDVHIRALRAKLDDDGSKYIKTIRGVGYRYVEEVK